MLRAGDTFLLPKFQGGYDHLWIILLDPEPSSGTTIMANMTSWKFPYQDSTTVLTAGEHPFIKHDSIVNYGDARTVDAAKIEQSFKIGIGSPQQRCSAQLLQKIQSGLMVSPRTPNNVKLYFRKRLEKL